MTTITYDFIDDQGAGWIGYDDSVDAIANILRAKGIPATVEQTGGGVMVGHIYSAQNHLCICFDGIGVGLYEAEGDDAFCEELKTYWGADFPDASASVKAILDNLSDLEASDD